MAGWLILIVILVVLAVWFVSVYNALVRMRNQADNAWSQIDVQLKRRHDLIPNLVETAKGYVKHERGTLEAVTNARAQAMGAKTVAEAAKAEGALGDALSKFMLASVSFWTVRAQGIVWGYYSLFNIARMPDEAFRGVFKAVFTFALPVLLVSNVPVRVLVNTLTSPGPWLVLLGLGVIWALISEWFWRFSIRRYTSASN